MTCLKVEIDNPKSKEGDRKGKDLSDHFPIVITGNQLKIISYNTQFLPRLISPVKDKKTLGDIEKIVGEITRYFSEQDADVCCVQELFDNKANECMEKGMLKRGYLSTNRVGNASLAFLNGGVRIFVKQRLVNKELVIYEHIYKNKIDYFIRADAFVNKGINHTFFKNKSGTKYHIFNTHMQAYYPTRDHYAEVTLAQCVELKKFIEMQKAKGIIFSDDKVLVCGDFNIPKVNNTEKGNYLYEKMKRIMGPRFHFLDIALAPKKPLHTMSDTNTYNGKFPSACGGMDITVDMGIVFDSKIKIAPVDEELSDIYGSFQLAISHYVRKNATFFTKWLLPESKTKTLKVFNEKVRELMQDAYIMRKQNKNPLDDAKWFSDAVNLLSGPHPHNVGSKQPRDEFDIELQQTALLPMSNFPIETLEQCKQRIDLLLYNLKQLHAQIHKDYIESPDEYRKIFKASLKLHHVLLNAADQFFKKSTSQSFQTFQQTCFTELDEARKVFVKHCGTWSKISPIIKGIIGVIVGILASPAFLLKNNLIRNYRKTFFQTPETEKLFNIKNDFENNGP